MDCSGMKSKNNASRDCRPDIRKMQSKMQKVTCVDLPEEPGKILAHPLNLPEATASEERIN